jgi:hypothetical protein
MMNDEMMPDRDAPDARCGMPEHAKDSLANPKSPLINYFLINSFPHI